MDFSLDPDTLELARVTRQFCEKRIAPHSADWDRGVPIDPAVFSEMADLGLTSLRIPSTDGGRKASFVECGTVSYEVGRADVGLALLVVNTVFWSELMPLMTPAIRDRWTPRVAAGAPFSIMLTEPGSGSDASALKTTARRDGDSWVINGEKASVTYAGLAEMGLVFARTGGPGSRGISLIATPWDAPGIEKRVYNSVGERVTQRGQVFFTDVRAPLDHLVGEENKGFREAMVFFDYNRAFLALICIGAAEKSLDEICKHVVEREVFGGPLARFQGVTFPIAEHLTKLEAAKLLAYKVLTMRDAGLPHSKEAAMIKWFGIVEAYEAIRSCLLLSGWPGYSTDLPYDRRMRDVMGLELGDGTAQIMKMVVGREVLGREALAYSRPAVIPV